MNDYHRIPYVNIDRSKLSYELVKRGAYYSNVAVWTLMFSLPLFMLLDVLFMKDDWVFLLLVRLIFFSIAYFFYIFGTKRRWNYELILNLVVGVNVVLVSIIAGIIPIYRALPYFLLSSVMVLLLNTILFWRPLFAQLHSAISFTIIIFLYSVNNESGGYTSLISNGGGVYFLVSVFSILIAYNRYQIVTRETEKNLIIEESNRRILEQN